MDELNMFHVLAPNIQEIGRGVKLCGQDEIASRTLVCYLDGRERFHYGFGYKNGTNLRVVCWEGNGRRDKAAPKGAFIIAFNDQIIEASFHEVNANDFDKVRGWFDDEKQQNVREELVALIDKHDRVNDLIGRLAGLTIQELDKVNEKIDELRGN